MVDDHRIKAVFRNIKTLNLFGAYQQIRLRCEQVAPGLAIYRPEPPRPPPTFGGVPPPRQQIATPANGWRTNTTTTIYNRPAPIMAKWRATPCWKLEKAMTTLDLLPDITAGETVQSKRERRITLTLAADDCAKLRNGPGYVVHRLG